MGDEYIKTIDQAASRGLPDISDQDIKYPDKETSSHLPSQPKLSEIKSLDVDMLVKTEVSSRLEAITREYDKKIQDAQDLIAKKTGEQQEKFIAAATIFTAVLAFVASEATLLAKAPSEVFLSVSLVVLGSLVLFASLILHFTLMKKSKDFKLLMFLCIGLIVLGVILNGWTTREIIRGIISLFCIGRL